MHTPSTPGYLRSFLGLAAALVLLGAQVLASTSGTLTGRVTDASTHLALGGVKVSVHGSALSTFTDASGDFVLQDIPQGQQQLFFSYVGYPDQDRTVQITADKTEHFDFAFGGEVVRMDALVISGNLIGEARAINFQRSSDALSNIIAADAIGKFPDQNAAESLQRVPGLALYRDQGEGRFIIVRGVNSQYNSVSLNGASLATPEAGSRNVPLDVIGSDSLAAAEVFKVVTPDMDSEGLGGSVNLRTRSAFDSETTQLELGGAAINSRLRGTTGAKLNMTYADFLMDGKFGYLVSASMQRRPFGSQNFEEGGGWSLVTSPTDGQKRYVFNQIAYRDYEMVRDRNSINASFDFKPDAETSVYLRTSYSDFSDKENRWVTLVPFTSKGKVVALSDNSASFTGVTGVSKRLRMREKIQRLSSAVLGFERSRGDWTFDGLTAASRGRETKPDELEGRFDTKAASEWTYVFTDAYHITSTNTGGSSASDPAQFSNAKGSLKQAYGLEEQFSALANAKLSFGGGLHPSFFKTGLSYRSKKKNLDKESSDISSGPSGYTFSALAENAGDYPYFSGPRISASALDSLFQNSRSSFVFSRKEADSILSDFDSQEDVLGAYAMGNTKIDGFSATAGLRMENTQFDTTGWEQRGSVYRQLSQSKGYTDWNPGIILRYDLTKRLVLRSSYTQTLSRPSFTETALSRTVKDDAASPTVSQGNPALKPLRSHNYDLSAEYYLPSLGLLSVSGFYKDLRDFSYQASSGLDSGTGYPLTSYLNGPKGHIQGLELAYNHSLRFLPKPFNGLGLLANFTFSESQAEFPNRAGEKLPFIGQSKRIGNAGISYETHGFFARLAANYRSPRLREDEVLGATAAEDRWVDSYWQLDLSLRYRFASNLELYGELVNITNEPFRVHFGGPGTKRFVQFEEYDMSVTTGIRWKL
jgi:TonB-dependent receptor